LGSTRLVNQPLQAGCRRDLCWAACIAMAAECVHRPPVRVCDLERLHSASNYPCCTKFKLSECYKSCLASDLVARFRSVNMYAAAVFGRPLQFNEVVAQINSGSPVAVGIDWNGTSGHVVLIVGYGAGDMVVVHDPGRAGPAACGPMKYSALLQYAGMVNAKWNASWINIH
jgi:hypothetical protein